MKKDDYLNDDFLRDLIRQSPLDSPSDDFVDRVMATLQTAPEAAEVKKPFYLYLKASVPYAISALVLVFVIGTSDLAVFNWLPGKETFMNHLLPYLETMFTVFKSAFASKYVSWGILISVSAGALYLIDQVFSRRSTI